MKFRRFLATMMTVLMLISMMPTAMAAACNHFNTEWRWPNGKPANCQDWKESELYCKDCGEVTWSLEQCGDCKVGKWVLDPYADPPTCTQGSIEIGYCKYCGEEIDERNVDPLGHDWGSWTWDYEPTCQEGGYRHRMCKRCNMRDEEETGVGDHNWGSWKNVTSATCVEKGKEERKCSVCGKTESRTTDYASHNWGDWKLVDKGDCKHPGKEERKCSVCGKTESRTTEEGSHNWGSWGTKKDATCTDGGKETRKCSLCGKEQSRGIDALGHKWGAWVIIQEAKPRQVGIRERKCSRCGMTEREEFYPDGTYKKGDKGDTVEDLQGALNDLGFDCGKADGIFGNNTENAVEEWQETNGYPVDGILWPDQVDELLGNNGAEATLAVYLFIQNSPANGSYYVLNERAEFAATVENISDEPLYDVELSFTSDDGTFALDKNDLLPGQNITVPIGRKIGEIHVANGFYSGFAYAAGITEDGEEVTAESDAIWLPCGADENADFQYVTVEKSITSTPANGEYYVQGETISFLIKVVIPEGKTITDLEITDPLKGSNEDATLDRLPTATSADNTEYVFNYVVTAEDVERGYVENSACASFFDTEGDAWVEEWSETVGAPTGGEIQQDGIVLTKSVVSTAEYYYCGDTVTFAIDIANTSNETYSDVIVYDPILEFAELKTYEVMEPGFSDTIEFTYTVTIDDVLHGSVENTAFVIRPGGADAQDRIYSNTVSVLTAETIHTIGGTDYQLGGLEVSKEVFVSLPVNGQYFTPGETVSYAITVKNICGRPLHEVMVRDSLYSCTEPVAIFPDMQPGDTFTASFGYRVTEMDAIRGYVKNIASVVGYDPEGKAQSALTNEVEILTGMEGDFPFGVITEMTIVKEETSTPANGSYYTEGETISYQITYTNSGETDFGETLVYDTLSEGMDEIASAEMLSSGDSRICYFSYVVTADDVAKGYVANSAVAKYDIGGGYTNTAISNVVVSDTDGDPNTTYVPGTGEFDWEKLRGTDGAVEDTCYIKALSRDGDSVEYEVHFCTKHAQTQNSILTMAKAATTPEKQQMVWEYAYALWQKDIDAMYQEILPACDDAAKITVMSERVTHLSMIANTQFALKIAEPGQPAETAYAVAQLWQDKCIDLCYLMNTAPSERVDSIFNVERAQNEAEIYEACSCVITEEAEGKILCADQYCPAHSFTYEMMELLLLTENSVENWATVRSLWEIELNTVYKALDKAASEEGGMAYLAEYAAYLAWLPAYEQCLNMVYPENPEVVAEVMVNTIMNRVLDACGRTK